MSIDDPDAIRPNGRPYRRRKGVELQHFFDADECEGFAVLRTHDVELARRIAYDLLIEHEHDPDSYSLQWWRLVPFDPHHTGHDTNWINDPVRGVPTVVFEP